MKFRLMPKGWWTPHNIRDGIALILMLSAFHGLIFFAAWRFPAIPRPMITSWQELFTQ